jgi:hypothetical protein
VLLEIFGSVVLLASLLQLSLERGDITSEPQPAPAGLTYVPDAPENAPLQEHLYHKGWPFNPVPLSQSDEVRPHR